MQHCTNLKIEGGGRKKSNSIAFKCIIHWGRIEREIGWWEIETPMVLIYFCVGVCVLAWDCLWERDREKQKAMKSQSIIGNGRFSHLIFLIELNPELHPPLQIDWRRTSMFWWRSCYWASVFAGGCDWKFLKRNNQKYNDMMRLLLDLLRLQCGETKWEWFFGDSSSQKPSCESCWGEKLAGITLLQKEKTKQNQIK